MLSTVRRLLPHSLRACFIPQPSPGLSLVQGLVHLAQPSAFIRLVPPLPFSPGTLACKQAATHQHLDSDVLLHTRPLASGSVISLPSGLLPSSSFVLPQVHLMSAGTVTCPRTLMSLPLGVLAPPPKRRRSNAAPLDFSAFPTSDLDALSPERPTCPSFSDLPHYLVKELRRTSELVSPEPAGRWSRRTFSCTARSPLRRVSFAPSRRASG